MSGLFIVFEGIDGCGKSTQARLLYDEFNKAGKPAVLTREPGGTAIGEKIRSVIIDKANSQMCYKTELLLYAAARAQIVNEVIAPALESGNTVICDRFTDSTVAYQAYARGLELSMINDINVLAAGGVTPDIVFLLDIPPELALKRRFGKADDRLEAETGGFMERAAEGYKKTAQANPRFCTVNADADILQIHSAIKKILKNGGFL